MALATAFYGFLGLLMSFRLACDYVEERWALLATFAIWWASSLPVYMYFNPSWSHAHSAFAVNQAREAVETLWSCYGAQGLYSRDPLQRHLRDVLAINQHFSFNFDIAGAAYGVHALGGRYANPTM